MPVQAVHPTSPRGPSVVTVPPVDYPTWDSWRSGLRDRSHKTVRDRFTVAKAKSFVEYARRTPQWRQLAAIALTPAPSLLASLIAPLVPLQDPALGVQANAGFCVHLFVTISLTVFGAMVQARAAVGLTHEQYSTLDIAAVAALAALHLLGVLTFLGVVWRFPVPFSWALSFVPWMVCLVWSHVLVLRGRLRSPSLRNRLLFYLPSLAAQVSQVVLYPVYSAAFEAAGPYGQVALIAAFPLLKRSLKSQILLVSHHLGDYAREVAVCSVEISASMYQAMIMQNSPTLLSSAMVIGLDVAQGLLDIRYFMEHRSVVPYASIVPDALQLIERGAADAFDDSMLTKHGTRVRRLLPSHKRRVVATNKKKSSAAAASAAASRTHDLRVVTHALELLQSAESVLLVEYLEVAVPIANSIFLFVAALLPSAVYNPKLEPFYGDKQALRHAMTSISTYMALQAATLVAMCVVIHVRYRVSALALLGFALESQAWSMQGKMVAWLPVILAFSVVHYGVDFTFQFDFGKAPSSVNSNMGTL